jgi:hypothetical protein
VQIPLKRFFKRFAYKRKSLPAIRREAFLFSDRKFLWTRHGHFGKMHFRNSCECFGVRQFSCRFFFRAALLPPEHNPARSDPGKIGPFRINALRNALCATPLF